MLKILLGQQNYARYNITWHSLCSKILRKYYFQRYGLNFVIPLARGGGGGGGVTQVESASAYPGKVMRDSLKFF